MPLSAKEATERLEKFKRASIAGTTTRLNLFATSLGLFSRLDAYILNSDSLEAAAIGARIRKMPASALRLIWKAFAPGWVKALANIQLAKSLNYQGEYDRSPFRTPNLPEVADGLRGKIAWSAVHLHARFPCDPKWLAEWVGYLDPDCYQYRSDLLLAGAIDCGDEDVLRILLETISGKHPTAAISRAAVRALLISDNRDAWSAVEQLLLKAQRQEGLRQTILEAIDEGHPEAFRRFLRLLLEHDLLRFSSAQRAVGVWLQLPDDLPNAHRPDRYLVRLLDFLEGSSTPDRDSPLDVFLWLWSKAFSDVQVALKEATTWQQHPDPEVRRVTVFLVQRVRLGIAAQSLVSWLSDPSPMVASTAMRGLAPYRSQYLRLLRIEPMVRAWIPRLPVKPEDKRVMSRSEAITLLVEVMPTNDLASLEPFLADMNSDTRCWFAARLHEYKNPQKRREIAFRLLADTSQSVRHYALSTFGKGAPGLQELPVLEEMLKRSGVDVRTMAMSLILRLPDAQVCECAERLSRSKDKPQQRAALEIAMKLGNLRPSGRAADLLARIREMPELGEASRRVLGPRAMESNRNDPTKDWTIENGLGLLDLSQVTFADKPASTGVKLTTLALGKALTELDDLVHEHRLVEVKIEIAQWAQEGQDTETVPLGAVEHGFPRPHVGADYQVDSSRLPLRDIWEEWAANSKVDPLHLLLASHLAVGGRGNLHMPDWMARAVSIPGLPKLRYGRVVPQVCAWIAQRGLGTSANTGLLNVLDECVHTTSGITFESVKRGGDWSELSWRQTPMIGVGRWAIEWSIKHGPAFWSNEELLRLFKTLRFVDEPLGRGGRKRVERADKRATEEFERDQYTEGPNVLRHLQTAIMTAPPRIPLEVPILEALVSRGLCSEMDALDQILVSHRGFTTSCHFVSIAASRRKREKQGLLEDLTDKLIDRILQVELGRGELPTPVSAYACQIKSGIRKEHILEILKADVTMTGARSSTTLSRPYVFLMLLTNSRPYEADTPEIVADEMRTAKIPEARLLELAFLAPQWALSAELALGWDGLSEAAWWFHAHTKDDRWSIPDGIKELWTSEISERTRLSPQRLIEGAVDVDWYSRFRPNFDTKRWTKLDKFVKFASSGSGHSRVRLFAQAMDGHITKEALVRRIVDKRNNDAVRAFGLLPLPEEGREAEITARYDELVEYRTGSRQFGAMKQASEKLAVYVGMENLARSAGYPDPLRLQWAMEAKTVEDLREGKEVLVGDVLIRLDFDLLGNPRLTAKRGDRELKEIPASIKKDPLVAELSERRRNLKKQAQRMRRSLEDAMTRGDAFQPGELVKLAEHPGLLPMLQNLAFIADSGEAGFLSDDAKILLDAKGNEIPMPASNLRVAHPFDFLDRGDWPDWQRALFAQERVQPFKQLFRELYVPTEAERTDFRSTRYGGHQVQPRQALTILGTRGWVIRPEEGVRKSIHEAGLIAALEFDETFYSPADVEGLTIRAVRFFPMQGHKPLALADVPPRVFSETMRDIDLIVSVASMVGIDPEASESTVDMRASVVRETGRLLRLDNFELKPRYVVVKGALAEYTVHLGSGEVQQLGRGHLVIIAVRQPQRGRLFLPFADDDPRTAEIVSKVILLARDNAIQDPTILNQIVRA